MTTPKRTYPELVETVKAATGEPTEAALRTSFARIQATLDTPRPARWRWVLVGTLATVVASVVMVAWLRTPPAPLVASIASFSGPVDLLAPDSKPVAPSLTQLPVGAVLTLGPLAQAQLEVGGVAEVALSGPSALTMNDQRVVLKAGRAAFSVRKRPPGTEFAIEAGDTRVVVHGTRFELAVVDGRLRGVRVSEGLVELRTFDGTRSLLELGAGKSWGDDFEALQVPRVVPPQALSSVLVVNTEPSGAAVDLDGIAWGISPLVLRVTPGRHVAKAALDGRLDARLELTVEAGREKTALLALPKRPTAPEDEVEPKNPRRPTPPPQDPLALAQRALQALRCDEVDRAVTETVRQGDESVRARGTLLRAECQLRSGQKAAALALFQDVAKQPGPSAEVAGFEAAKLLAELTRKADALTQFETYLASYPTGRFATEAEFRRCELLIDLQRRDQARPCLEAFSTKRADSPRAPEAVFLLATLARVEHRWADAAKGFDQYAHSPQVPRAEEALFQRALCLDRGSLPGLEEAKRLYLQRFPTGPSANQVRALGKQ